MTFRFNFSESQTFAACEGDSGKSEAQITPIKFSYVDTQGISKVFGKEPM